MWTTRQIKCYKSYAGGYLRMEHRSVGKVCGTQPAHPHSNLGLLTDLVLENRAVLGWLEHRPMSSPTRVRGAASA